MNVYGPTLISRKVFDIIIINELIQIVAHNAPLFIQTTPCIRTCIW